VFWSNDSNHHHHHPKKAIQEKIMNHHPNIYAHQKHTHTNKHTKRNNEKADN
jgi:hypothetical protein